jgi:hypothetical protein
MALVGSLAKQFNCGGFVGWQTPPMIGISGQVVLGCYITLLCRPLKPLRRFSVVLDGAMSSICVNLSEQKL